MDFLPEVLVALAFFALIAYAIRTLKASRGTAATLAAIAACVMALPAILYALQGGWW